MELRDALGPGLAHVSRTGIGIEVVRIDLKGHQTEGIETARLDDRHVVGGANRRTCEVDAGRGPEVGHPGERPFPERREELGLLQGLEQAKGVAAADEDGFRGLDLAPAGGVGHKLVHDATELLEPGAELRAVAGAIVQREGHEEHPPAAREQVEHLALGVGEVALAMIGRIGEQQESAHGSRSLSNASASRDRLTEAIDIVEVVVDLDRHPGREPPLPRRDVDLDAVLEQQAVAQ